MSEPSTVEIGTTLHTIQGTRPWDEVKARNTHMKMNPSKRRNAHIGKEKVSDNISVKPFHPSISKKSNNASPGKLNAMKKRCTGVNIRGGDETSFDVRSVFPTSID